MHRAVRVRYAPSPTGYLHLGGLRTALYNYLFAKQHGGVFILRIEDTDQSRLVPGSTESLISTLAACGIPSDEGPTLAATGGMAHTGACGPYIQSQRLAIYTQWAAKLLDSGAAYRCFCTQERLTKLREDQQRRGVATLYDRACARLPPAEASRRAADGAPHVVRLRMPDGGFSTVQDLVVGEVRFANAGIDDQVRLLECGGGGCVGGRAPCCATAAGALSAAVPELDWFPLPQRRCL
jgi:nondiscriminating glutamyl-tRNA synthetase